MAWFLSLFLRVNFKKKNNVKTYMREDVDLLMATNTDACGPHKFYHHASRLRVLHFKLHMPHASEHVCEW